MKIISNSVKETKTLGKKFASILKTGDVVLLQGPLGVGKTVFIKGVLSSFGIEEDDVLSPSFTLIREYDGKEKHFFHIDLYRIEKAQELIGLGYQQYLYSPQGITFVEWGKRVADIIDSCLIVDIDFKTEQKRKVSFEQKGLKKDKLKTFFNKVK